MVTELSEEAFDAFVEKNKFVIIDCWAQWCGPCRRMGPIIDDLAVELEGKIAVAKLNVDDAPGISEKYRIEAIPTLLFFKDAKAMNPLVGLRSKADIMAQLKDYGMDKSSASTEPVVKQFAIPVTDATFDTFVKSKKFVLIDCWASWCKPCQRMGPIIEKLAEISQKEIAVGKLDVDSNSATSLKYSIQSIPTLLIFKDGKKVDDIVGLDPSLTADKLKKYVLGS
ncbi:MAG: thioredoxin [Candidatus Methanomethylophilaceae archaeon]